MRAFIAVTLPKEIKKSLKHLQCQLQVSTAGIKWVEPENIHLTLKFLGEVEEKKIVKLKGILEEALKDKTEFLISLSSLGVFPDSGFPRIIWIGINRNNDKVKLIAEELENKTAQIGVIKGKKAFSAHITLGRIKLNLDRENLIGQLKKLEHDLPREELEFLVNKITLFKSTLTAQGPIYEAFKETSLKTN